MSLPTWTSFKIEIGDPNNNLNAIKSSVGQMNSRFTSLIEQQQNIQDDCFKLFDIRMKCLEEHFAKTNVSLKNEINNRMNALEDRLSGSIEDIRIQLTDAVNNLMHMMDSMDSKYDKHIGNLENRTSYLERQNEELQQVLMDKFDQQDSDFETSKHKQNQVINKLQAEFQRFRHLIISTTDLYKFNNSVPGCSKEDVNIPRSDEPPPKKIINEVKFQNDTYDNPAEFMCKMEGKYNLSLNRFHFVKNIHQYLEGEPLIWFNAMRQKINTFTEFKKFFLRRYWDEHEQEKVRNEILHGKFNVKNGISKKDYFIHLYCKGRRLNKSYPDRILMYYLSRHFQGRISDEIYYQDINDVQTFLRVLDESSKTPTVGNDRKRRGDLNNLSSNEPVDQVQGWNLVKRRNQSNQDPNKNSESLKNNVQSKISDSRSNCSQLEH